MSDIWAPGIYRWFRSRVLPRAVTRLCAVALVLNMFAPILWALAAPTPDTDAPVACHEIAPGDATGHADDHSKPIAGHAPHCPLCVLFGGTAWAPPTTVSAVPTAAPQRVAATTVPGEALPAPLPSTLRPSPRGPPSLI